MPEPGSVSIKYTDKARVHLKDKSIENNNYPDAFIFDYVEVTREGWVKCKGPHPQTEGELTLVGDEVCFPPQSVEMVEGRTK